MEGDSRLPWKREFTREFGVPSALWVLIVIGITVAAGGLVLLLRDRDPHDLVFPMGGVLCAAYFAIPVLSRLLARRFGSNSASIEGGALVVTPHRLADQVTWGLTLPVFALCLAAVIFLGVTDGYLFGANSGHAARAAGNLVAAVVLVVCWAVVVWWTPFNRRAIVLDRDGISYHVGKHAVVDLDWEEITAVSAGRRGDFDTIEFATRTPTTLQKNVVGTPIAGQSHVPVVGFTVEPNALLRRIREYVAQPECRQTIASRIGREALTAGPRWRDVSAVPPGECWTNDGNGP